MTCACMQSTHGVSVHGMADKMWTCMEFKEGSPENWHACACAAQAACANRASNHAPRGNGGGFYAEVNLVTALVPSDTACLASSPGRMRRIAVWISRDVTVGFLLYRARRAASVAILSKMSLMNEFMMPMALEEIPVSGCTCFSTL